MQGHVQMGAAHPDYSNRRNAISTAAPATPCNPSAFGSIENAARYARETSQRVQHFVERLCGSEPTQASATGEKPGSANGLLSEAEERASSIQESMAFINASMDRLEKRLP